MSPVYLLSIVVQGAALAWSLELVRRYRDWRLAFLSLTLTLMLVWRGVLLLAEEGARLDSFGVEWPSLIISTMSLVAMFFLSSLLQELQRTRRSNERSVAELAEHERRLRAIIETEPECVKLLGPDSVLLDMNRAGLRMIEADSLDQVRGRSVLDLVLPQYRQAFSELTDRVLRGESGTLEFEIEGLHGTRRWLETHATPYRDGDGQIVSLLGVTRDVTERRRVDAALRSAEALFRNLVENSLVGIQIVQDGKYAFANAKLAEIFGYSEAEILALDSWTSLVADEGRNMVIDQVRQRADGETPRAHYVFQGIRKDRSVIDIEIRSDRIELNGRPAVLGMLIDITERKKGEKALQRSEALMRAVTDNTTDAVFVKDLESQYQYINPAGAAFIGRSPEEIIGRDDHELFADTTAQRIIEEDQQLIQSHGLRTVDEVIENLSGERRTYQSTKGVFADVNGLVLGLVGIARDVTVQRQTEAALRESENRFRSLTIATSEVVWRTDAQGRVFENLSSWEAFTGQGPQEHRGDGWLNVVHPEDRERASQAWQQAVITQSRYETEYRLRRHDGEWRHMLARGVSIRDDAGCVLEWVGLSMDITDRKRAEAAARESGQFAQAALDALSANIAILDESGIMLGVNRAWREFASLNSASLAAVCEGSNYLSTCEGTSGSGLETALSFAGGIRAVINGTQDEFTLEYPCHSPTEQRWFVGRVTRFPGNGPRRIVVAHENITQRKLVQQSLLESRTLLEQAQRIARLGAWVSGANSSDSLWWSDQTYEIFGLSREQFDGSVRSFSDSIYPDDRPAVQEVSRAALAGERPYEIEHRIILPDGTIRWVHELAEVIRSPDGSASQMIGVVRDITARREADEALRASQAMLELVLDSIPQGVFWKDRNSIYLGANRVARETWGLKASELVVGLSDFQLPSPTSKETKYCTLKDREVMDSNQPQFGIEETLTRADGSTIWLETNKVPMHDPDGHVIGVLGTWQDITERKRVDDELRASRERLQTLSRQLLNAQEVERRHIARELHDQIGQSLTAIKLNLKTLQPPAHETTAWATLLETITVVDQTLEQVRTLSLDLRPSMLDDLGLVSALRWYLDRQAKRVGFSVQFAAESPDSGVSKEIETTCFRVAQEIVTNIARHANARNVRVTLHRFDSELELLIQDDGVGFDLAAANERAARGGSMGLLGMQERVMIVGGRVDIQSAPSLGTEVRVCFPLMLTDSDELED